MQNIDGPVIGIDLGTTYCCVAMLNEERVEVFADEEGNRTFPSCVAFTDTEILIGGPAKNQISRNSRNTVYDAKRLLGRKMDEFIQANSKQWAFRLVSKHGNPFFEGRFDRFHQMIKFVIFIVLQSNIWARPRHSALKKYPRCFWQK